MIRGRIRTLDDVRLLPNLEELFIAYQGEMDISALTSAKNLRWIQIKQVHISDCSTLGTLKNLENICLFGTDISDFTALESCEWLERLDVGLCKVRSMEQIGVYPYLEQISLACLKMDSLDGLERMPKLKASIWTMPRLATCRHFETACAGDCVCRAGQLSADCGAVYGFGCEYRTE